LQIWLSRTQDLTPWAGGGFGMFASADVRGSRHLHAFALHASVRRELGIPEPDRELARRALSFPARRTLERLAVRLAAQSDDVWGAPDAIELQIWATRFEPGTLAPSSYLVRALVVPLEH
jgi:hypothetical protein